MACVLGTQQQRLWCARAAQVITEESSFGRLAALRSLRFRSVFTVRSPGGVDATRECLRDNFDTFEELANSTWLPI